jgi:hypothetical protein
MAFGYYGYVLQAERSRTRAELRAEDARRGELAAALSRASAMLTAALGRPFRRRRATPGHERVSRRFSRFLCPKLRLAFF